MNVDRIAEVVRQALEGLLAEEGGGIVTSFALSAEYLDSDGDRCWAIATAEDQSPSQTFGLLRLHTMDIERVCKSWLSDVADDE